MRAGWYEPARPFSLAEVRDVVDYAVAKERLDTVFHMLHGTDRASVDGLTVVERGLIREMWIRRGALLFRGTTCLEAMYVVVPWKAKVSIRAGKQGKPHRIQTGKDVRVFNVGPAEGLWWEKAQHEARAMLLEVLTTVVLADGSHEFDRYSPKQHEQVLSAIHSWARAPHRNAEFREQKQE